MKEFFYGFKGMRKFTMLLFLLPSTMLFTLAGVSSALAEDQIVSLTPAISSQNTGSSFILTANYDVSDNDNTLSTLGVQFHYDSSKLQFDEFSNVFTPGFIAQQGPFDDTGDSDADADTDKYVLISWFDFSGNWPNQALPITLTDLNFTLSAGASDGDSTPVNVNITQTAASHTALGNNATINILKVPVCGDGVVGGTEACDDGATNGDTTCGCQSDCTYTAAATSCEDGLFCNGDETCDGSGTCQAGTSPVTDDGVGCTDDSCDETNDVVVNTANNSNCDNGLFCDGSETCNATLDCQAGTPPVTDDGNECTDDSCDETNDVVVNASTAAATPCGDQGVECSVDDTCDGAGACVDNGFEAQATPCGDPSDTSCNNPDTCDGTGVCESNYEANSTSCGDGLFCNGDETCDGSGTCQAGTSPVTDDGVGCTDDSCDETNDVVVNALNDSNCDNGQFCDGSETCDATQDCQAGSDPCSGGLCNDNQDACVGCLLNSDCDNGAFCDGSETCDGSGDCQAGTSPVTDDGVGCTDDSCDETNDVVVNALNDSNCDNGQFCDGSETCDAVNDCQAGTSPVTDDGVGCTDDSCDEVNDVVVNTANNANCSDDGAFCNGDEFCDTVNDCTSTGDPCAASKVCDDTNDVCVACQVDGDCDDGAFCNGAETCNAGDCQSGTPPVVDDGVGCTDDSCDEGNDVVVNTANNANCSDDGAFCNGDEFCDALNDCTSTGDPCAANDICDDTNDVCGECLVDGNCDDGAFCNGAETCNAGVCQSGTPPEVDDDDSCTDDSCDEVNDVIVNTTNDTDTDNDTILDCNDNCLNDANTDQADADNDDVGDACDVCPGFDDAIDTDNDGVPDGCDCPDSDADFDSDGIEDCADNAPCNANPLQLDSDGDGVGDAAEMGPMGTDDQFDGNGDTIPDIDQENVASLYVNYCQDYVTLSTADDCSLVDLINVPTEEVADLPIGVDFPFGLFEFILDCDRAPGFPVTITLNLPTGTNLPGDFGVDTYYKFGPTLDNAAYHWYPFLYDDVSQTGVTFLDDAVTMEFIDGVKGDDNLVADGVIIDLGGPAFVLDGDNNGGGGGSGGCFIDTLFSGFWKNK